MTRKAICINVTNTFRLLTRAVEIEIEKK